MQFAGLTCLFGLTSITMLQTHALDRQIDSVTRHHDREPALGGRQAAISRLQNQRVAALSSIVVTATLLFFGCREIDAFCNWAASQGVMRDGMILALLLGCRFVASLPARYYSGGRETPAGAGSFLKRQANILVFWAITGLPVSCLALSMVRAAHDLCWISAGIAACITLLFLRPFFAWIVLTRIGALRPVRGPVNRRIEALLNQLGFKMAGLFERKATSSPEEPGILIQGIGSTKRVLLPSGLLDRLNGDEIAAIVAHELGHRLAGHGVRRGAFRTGAVIVFVGLLWWLTGPSLPMAGLGITADAPAASVFTALLALGATARLLAMADHAITRQFDFHADGFVKGLLGPEGLTDALRKLSTNEPHFAVADPLHSLIHRSTPPACERVARIASFAPSLTPLETDEWAPATERLAWVGRSGLLTFHSGETAPGTEAEQLAHAGNFMASPRKKRRRTPNPAKQRSPAPAAMEKNAGNTIRKMTGHRQSRRSAVPA